jgi:hypothetical protein
MLAPEAEVEPLASGTTQVPVVEEQSAVVGYARPVLSDEILTPLVPGCVQEA